MTNDFSKQIDAWTHKVVANVTEVLRQSVAEALTRIVDRMPTDILPNDEKTKTKTKAAIQEFAGKLQIGDEARFISSDPKMIEAEFGNATRLPASMFRLTALEWNEIVAEIVARIKKAKE